MCIPCICLLSGAVMSSYDVAYLYSKDYCHLCNIFEKERFRSAFVHSLSDACGLLSSVNILEPPIATDRDLLKFHNSAYVDFLLAEGHVNDSENGKKFEEYGFEYDCPLRPGISKYVLSVSGASLSAAEQLCKKSAKIAVNWGGGWHHAGIDKASGFCYVNDCVLAILKLLGAFPRVLYIDLDVHHGDAVQDAFYATDKVMTLSLHHFSSGFFPGSGGAEEIGVGKGRYYNLNLPFLQGLNDDQFCHVIDQVLPTVFHVFNPSAVVVQCGADCLSGDPINAFILTPDSLVHAVKSVISYEIPTLLLGGGGYNRVNTAKCWTRIMGEAVLNQSLSEDIPEHEFFNYYGPSFEFSISTGALPNLNTAESVQNTVSSALCQLSHLGEDDNS